MRRGGDFKRKAPNNYIRNREKKEEQETEYSQEESIYFLAKESELEDSLQMEWEVDSDEILLNQ